MIGRLKCRLGRHTGQAQGGTAMFTCPRCGGSFWQTMDLSHIAARGDALIAAGRGNEALAYARDEIARAYGEAPESRANQAGPTSEVDA